MRLFNSMRNMLWNLIAQTILIVMGLFFKKVLLQTVGTENIGLNYLFNDIVILISIAELGVTAIIAYHLYEPLAVGNEKKVKQLIDFFRKIYAIIGLVVILVGIGIIPFLDYLVGETTLSNHYITIVFILFLLRSAESYFFSYKQILIYADQKSYIISVVDILTSIVYTVLSIVVLLYTRNFIYVISLEIIKKIINDIILMVIVNKKYPYIKMKNIKPLEKKEIIKIAADVKNAFLSKVSSAIIRATDNVIISTYFGIAITGLYSNYAMIFFAIESFICELIESVEASVGNLLVEEKGTVAYSVLRKITFISFFIVSISGCCVLQLSTSFVALWFGKEYILNDVIVWACVFNIFMHIIQLGIIQFAEAGGLFQQNKKIDVMGCIINVVLSIIGVKLVGIAGVFLATFVSLTIVFILRIRIVFKEILEINYFNYIKQILGYFLCFIIDVIVLKIIVIGINIQDPILEFLGFGIIAIILPLLINIFVYRFSEDYIYMIDIIKYFLNKKIISNIKRLNKK